MFGESIKNREQNMERNFTKLLDRYQKSKQLIDNLYSNIQTKDQPPPRSTSQHRQRQKSSKVLEEFEHDERSIGRKKHSGNSIENLNRLKETLSVRENVDGEKLQQMKILNKELKCTLREYISRTNDLEQKLKSKEQVVRQYEDEIKNSQDGVLKNVSSLKELKLKEDTQSKIIDDLKQNLSFMSTKLNRKKQKLKQTKEKSLMQDDHLQKQTQKFNYELSRLQQLCENFSNEIKEQEAKNQLLAKECKDVSELISARDQNISYLDGLVQEYRLREQELGIRYESEIEKRKESSNKVESLQKQLDEAKDHIQLNEAKATKMKLSMEEERKTAMAEFNEQLTRKQSKIKKLKSEINQIDQQNFNRIKEYEKQALQLEQQNIEMQSNINQNRDRQIQVLKAAHEQWEQEKKIILSNSQQKEEQLKEYALAIQNSEYKLQDIDKIRYQELAQFQEVERYINIWLRFAMTIRNQTKKQGI